MSWALVTGAAQGIGAATCRALASEGRGVLVHYRTSKEEAHAVADACTSYGVEAHCLRGDFSTEEGVLSFLSTHANLLADVDLLVNNMGPAACGLITQTPWNEWALIYQLNVIVPVELIKGLLPVLRRQQGAIINLGVAGVERCYADKNTGAYFAAKSALWAATRSLARELLPDQVRVNMVSPGYVQGGEIAHPSPKDLPLGREATPEEIAAAIISLTRESSCYVTGQNLEIAGGVRL